MLLIFSHPVGFVVSFISRLQKSTGGNTIKTDYQPIVTPPLCAADIISAMCASQSDGQREMLMTET